MKPGLKTHQGHPAGRDPREMTQVELREVGHEPMSPLQALRARCLDCCAQQAGEVALCSAVDCPAWPFRMGTDPWRKPASEARREAARRTMTELNARRNRGGTAPASPPSEPGIEPPLAIEPTSAPAWATARVDRVSETARHRGGGSGSGRAGDHFQEGSPSDDGPVITTFGETPERSAA
jgi:hypothetical protein